MPLCSPVNPMAHLTRLTELRLGSLTPERAGQAAEALALLPALRSLELVGEPIPFFHVQAGRHIVMPAAYSSRPVVAITEVMHLHSLTKLESLVLRTPLSDARDGDVAVPGFCEALTRLVSLRRLELHGALLLDDNFLQDLNEDDLSGKGRMLTLAVNSLSALTHLELNNFNKDHSFWHLSRLSSLTGLSRFGLSGSVMTEDGRDVTLDFMPWRCLASLTSLDLSNNDLHNHFVEDKARFSEGIAALTGLRHLNLSHNFLDAEDLVVDVMGGSLVSISFPLLRKLTTLTSLDLSHNNLGGVGGVRKVKFAALFDNASLGNLANLDCSGNGVVFSDALELFGL